MKYIITVTLQEFEKRNMASRDKETQYKLLGEDEWLDELPDAEEEKAYNEIMKIGQENGIAVGESYCDNCTNLNGFEYYMEIDIETEKSLEEVEKIFKQTELCINIAAEA